MFKDALVETFYSRGMYQSQMLPQQGWRAFLGNQGQLLKGTLCRTQGASQQDPTLQHVSPILSSATQGDKK